MTDPKRLNTQQLVSYLAENAAHWIESQRAQHRLHADPLPDTTLAALAGTASDAASGNSGLSKVEIMLKALAGRVPIVAAISAASNLAAEFAADNDQTLVGFLRDGRMNIYANPRRIEVAGGTR